MKFNAWLLKRPKWILFGLAWIAAFCIGVIDYRVTFDISLSVFYLLPIASTAWFIGRGWGVIISIFSALLWFVAAIHAASLYPEISPYPWLPYWNTAVKLTFFILVSYLLGSLKRAYEQQIYYARTDQLTEAANRRWFLEILKHEMKRFMRYEHPFTLVYFDLDNFKTINDKFGHKIGDKLLRNITKTIKENIRSIDVLGRIGGDEFALFLPETNYQSASIALKRIHQKLVDIFEEQYHDVGLSIGAVTFISMPPSVDDMMDKADKLMYEAKKDKKIYIRHEVFR